jgi:hypothetical protein
LKAKFSLGFPPINATDSANQAINTGEVSCNACHSQPYKTAMTVISGKMGRALNSIKTRHLKFSHIFAFKRSSSGKKWIV